jgi:hypothetical protein
MTFQLDTLIAIAFLAPVLFFAILNIVVFHERGYGSAAKPTMPATPRVSNPMVAAVEAANDSEMRDAA